MKDVTDACPRVARAALRDDARGEGREWITAVLESPMHVEQTALHMGASQTFIERRERQESLRAWVGPRRPDFERAQPPAAPIRDAGAISEAARNALAASKSNETTEVEEPSNGPTDPKLLMLIAMVERMTGEKVRIYVPSSLEADAATERAAKDIQEAASRREAAAAAAAPVSREKATGVYLKEPGGAETAQQIDLAL